MNSTVVLDAVFDAYDDRPLPVGSQRPLLLPLPFLLFQYRPLVEGLFFARYSGRNLHLRQASALPTSVRRKKHGESTLSKAHHFH
ncbi:hypothetical protein ACL2XP_24760 [Sodalis sp. RH21]|uniref:hypothetical protein n=1 Tax=unclassified Sodalis (in: enterobacteria) TaxID=2636512 RepID=UPI0039B393AD